MDRFRTIRLLGSGGVADVWLAFDRRRREQVALKILRAQYSRDEGLLRRFRREAELITGLTSPNIVKVYGLEEEEGESPVLVMEYVPGADLKILLQLDGAMEPTYALRLLRSIVAGVAVAHRAGLVHRDLKPANILMTPEGTPKITDFGIAHDTAGYGLTEPGQTWGTSTYLAPEQAVGQPVTPATDIYSLGVILFEMLTGKVPFAGDDPVQVALAHLQQPTPSVHTFNPLIPPGIEQLVARMMAKEPSSRPANGDALVAILDRYLEGGETPTVLHDSDTLQAQSRSVARPNHTPLTPPSRRWGWVVAVVTLLIVGGSFVLAQGWFTNLMTPALADEGSPKAIALIPTPTHTPTLTPSATPTPLPTRRDGNGTDALAHHLTTPILVDGNSGEWGEVPRVSIENVVMGSEAWSGPADLSGTVAFAWDESNFYLMIDRHDDVHIAVPITENRVQGDMVELWLDMEVGEDYDRTEFDGDDFHFVFSAGDFAAQRAAGYLIHPQLDDPTPNRWIQVRAVPLPNGYILEAAIAWELLGGVPSPDTTVGYAIMLNDTDTPDTNPIESQLATTPQSPLVRPQSFGNLRIMPTER